MKHSFELKTVNCVILESQTVEEGLGADESGMLWKNYFRTNGFNVRIAVQNAGLIMKVLNLGSAESPQLLFEGGNGSTGGFWSTHRTCCSRAGPTT